jgi:hypothetical protein
MAINGRREQLRRIDEILSGLDADELDLDDPPPAVWRSIESALSSDEHRSGTFGRAGIVVEYSIDPHDYVIGTGADWSRFAEDNGAPEMTTLDGSRSLWSYMSSEAVREPWQLLVRRVRDDQVVATVPFRCDAPHVRRWFELVLSPLDDRSVHFRTTLLFEELRDTIALLDHAIEREADTEPVALCAWCGRGRSGDDWLDIETLLAVERLLERDPPPPLEYGICESCRRGMDADLLVGHSSTTT